MNKERPNLHFETKNKYFFSVLIALLPMILYGFYKNGILPYLNNDISIITVFRPLFFLLIGVTIGVLIPRLAKEKMKKENAWVYPLYGLMISMTLPIQMNPILIIIVQSIILWGAIFFRKKISPLFLGITLLGAIAILCKISYLNGSEQSHIVMYSILDIFFGRNIGGICSTSIFWCLISYIFLLFNPYYKRDIPIYILVTYIIMALLFEMLIPSGDLLKTILNSTVFFGSIFIAAEIQFSPYMEKGKMIYGIMTGISTFLLTRLLALEIGIYISIMINSLLVPVFDRIAIKIEEKKHNFCRTNKKRNFIV